MNPLLHSMPVDWTGNALSNRTRGEYHNMASLFGLPYRCIALDHGYFYTENLRILDGTGKLLKEDIDYQCVSFNAEVVAKTAKPCCAVIVIINPKVNENLYIDASMVGGPYEIVAPAIVQMSMGLLNNTRKLHWDNITGKPDAFAAAGHFHALWELFGFTPDVTILQRIAAANAANAGKVIDALYADFDLEMKTIEKDLDAVEKTLTSHIADTNNPHKDTAAKIGLGNVVNAGTAPLDALSFRGPTTYYATPASMKQSITADFSNLLKDHVDNRNNPHRNTAAQLQVYTTNEFNLEAGSYVDRGATLTYTSNVWGNTPNGHIPELRYNNHVGNLTSGMYPKDRFVNALPGRAYVMLPYGLWQYFPDVMARYIRKVGIINYLSGNFTDWTGAMNTANLYLTDLNAYPIGSLLFYHFTHTETSNTNNGTAIAISEQTGVMTRTAGGWTPDGV